ncbi:MAG: TonB-dependent receptor [Bacteroidaceae bacterium]|nr:TonB-dependent receptor [Bacteroidaceae bacterium]
MFKSNFLNFRALVMTICLALLPIAAIAQTTISGVVRETTGESIPGASVREKGTTNGAATDFDGNFSFKVSNPNATIVVSFVGYETQEIPLAGRKTLTVTLKSDDELLEDVVVVGYGTMKKKLVTGATVQVKGEDIAKLNTTNALTALQSSTPGVQITQQSGQPGSGFKVNIRGIGTTGDTAPLYVIDGVAGGSLDNINPADIERIDILKDAASAAIYGARAANGVILVTTKQGKEGKIELSYDGYVGWSNAYKRPATLKASEYMAIMDEKKFNMDGSVYDWSTLVPQSILDKVNAGWEGTDWWDLYKNKNAFQQNHSFNLTGGSDRSKFSMAFSYTGNEGIMGSPVESKYDRYTGRLNSEHILLKNDSHNIITIGENLSFNYNKTHQLAEGTSYWNTVKPTLTAVPLVPVFADNGDLYDYQNYGRTGWNTNIFDNPYVGLLGGDYGSGQRSRSFGLGATAYIVIEPIKDLKIRSQYNQGWGSSNTRNYGEPYSRNMNSSSSVYSVSAGAYESSSFDWENTISYVLPEFLKDNTFDVMVGASYQGDSWKFNMNANNEVGEADRLSILKGYDYAWLANIGALATNATMSSYPGNNADDANWYLASYFGRINWNFKETYMATATLRYDGSSNFARGHRWGFFPSFSAGWVVTNEPFMKETQSWLDQFKIRASWGQNGNQSIPPLQYLATVAFSDPVNHQDGYVFSSELSNTLNGDFTTGAYTDILANNKLTWETSEQVDLGFDANFLNNRLSLNFDWYYKKTKDWLVKAPTLDIYGTGAPYINGGDVKNTGFEIALGWNDHIGKDFRYHANFNIAINKNKVTKIANTEGIIRGQTYLLTNRADYVSVAKVGEPIGYFYGMSYDGIWQNQAQIDAARAAGKAVLDDAQPGDPIWTDYNNDGVITYAEGENSDRHKIGNPNPDVTMGLSFGFDYKGFDFNVTTYGAFGQQIMKKYRYDGDYLNYTTDIFKRWHGEGTSNTQPRLTWDSHADAQWISTRYMENASFLKIQNITVGYDFNKLWKNSPFGQLRLYFQAQNLLTFTGYSGVDPEIASNGSTAATGFSNYGWASGIDVGLYPTPRTYLIGVNIKF